MPFVRAITPALAAFVNPLTFKRDRSQTGLGWQTPAACAPDCRALTRASCWKGPIMKREVTAVAIATGLAFGTYAAFAQAQSPPPPSPPPAQSQPQSPTLKAVMDRGALQCGANGQLAGFGMPDTQGNWTGFDVDFCRAIAAAIFNDPTKVKFVPLTAANRFTSLQSGEIDVLSRNTTWTMSRDTTLGVDFAAVNYYDGQGFMVHKSLKVNSALELTGASVCVQQGTTTELNLADYFRSNNMELKSVTFATADEAIKAYDTGRCDSYTTDSSGLYGERVLLSDPNANIVLPEIISKEPLSPAVRQGDDTWEDIVRWTHYAMLDAEELGVSQNNVDDQMKSANPEIRRLLGVEGQFGAALGLSNDWAYRIIKTVGNYGETFERNVGQGSPLKIARGLNALWTKGGLQYGLPVR
jgi:general L-amino acid transport system substrate-binding protein